MKNETHFGPRVGKLALAVSACFCALAAGQAQAAVSDADFNALKQQVANMQKQLVGTGPGLALGASTTAAKKDLSIGKGASIGATTSEGGSIAIGDNAHVRYSNGKSAAHGDVAIGQNADINNYASQGGSVALGLGAKVENMAGGAEQALGFGQTTFRGVGDRKSVV